MRQIKGSDKGSKRTPNSANDQKPAPRRAKTVSHPPNKQHQDSPCGSSSLPRYTPPTLHRDDVGSEEAYGVDVDDLDNPRRSDDANAGFYSHFRPADGNAILEDDSDDEEDDDDDIGDEDDPSDSPSTVAVISAA
jgi:hypothetical protein